MLNFFDIFIFAFCNHDFIIHIDFIHIAASNTTTDDVTNQVTHRMFNTNLYYFLLILYSKLMKILASQTVYKEKAYNTCIAAQAAYHSCSGANRQRTYSL